MAASLSGGEQQMLAIGRGLMALPRLLMLDEPSLGLAPLMVNLVFETIGKINKEGVTVLVVEQNVHRTLQIAREAYVLETGRNHPARQRRGSSGGPPHQEGLSRGLNELFW